MLQICQNIKQARISRDKSQEWIAEKIGVKRATYKNWEKSTEPTLSTIKTISDILGVPVMTLLAGVIDLSAKHKIQPDAEFHITPTSYQLDQVRSSLSVLGSIFLPWPGLETDKRQDIEGGPIGGNTKLRPSKSKKGRRKGNAE